MKARDIFWVLLISLVPFIELRGAIPAGTALGLPWHLNLLCSVVGNLIPVPFILLLADWGISFMKRHNILPRLVAWLERKADKGAKKIEATAEKHEDISRRIPWGTCIGLFLFVAIPLPGTGAWTGALVAALTRMKKKYAIPSIFIGVLLAGVIVTMISYGVLAGLEWLL